MGDAGGRAVNLAAQAEYQFDLTDGLAGCAGHLFERGSFIGECPDRGITLLETIHSDAAVALCRLQARNRDQSELARIVCANGRRSPPGRFHAI